MKVEIIALYTHYHYMDYMLFLDFKIRLLMCHG